MADLIQIKRSSETEFPVVLAPGELAYSSNSKTLVIGDPESGSITIIGGENYLYPNVEFINTLSELSTNKINTHIDFLYSFGFNTYGIGAGTWKKITAPETPELWQKQSLDGAWWELVVESKIKPTQIGAVGDGSSDDTLFVRSALKYSAENSKILDLTGHSYRVKNQNDNAQKVIIPLNYTNVHVIGDKLFDNIIVEANSGDYRAIFGPTVAMVFDEWIFENIVFNKNCENNVIATPTTNGRYSISNYGFSTNGTNKVIVDGCIFKNSDAVVDVYLSEGQENKFCKLTNCIWENTQLGGSGFDYDQSMVNFTCTVGIVSRNVFQGKSWELAPRTAIELHCNNTQCNENVIDKFQIGVNLCIGLRYLETYDVNHSCSFNTLFVNRSGIFIWPYQYDTAGNDRLAGGNFDVSHNLIHHRWTQLNLVKNNIPRLNGIEFVSGSSNSLPLSDGSICDNQIIYDLPDGTEAHARVGYDGGTQPQFSPAIGWTSNATNPPNNFKNITIARNRIVNSPAMAIGLNQAYCSGIYIRENELRDCGISAHAISTAYKTCITVDTNLESTLFIENNKAIFSNSANYDCDHFSYLRERSGSSYNFIMRNNDLINSSANLMITVTGMDNRIFIEGGSVPNANTFIHSLTRDGSYVYLQDYTDALIKHKTGGSWTTANTGVV